jgi:general secretion pathway protein F
MWKSKIALKLPIISGIVISIEVSRFIRTLSIMLKNHVKLLTAVTVSKKIFNNLIIAKDFDSIESELYKGDKLSHILKDSLYMPQGSVAMLRIAEESGDLGEMLERIAQESEEETRVKVKRLLAFLEPVIIMVLALIVLLVVLSIFMAIMEMNVMK